MRLYGLWIATAEPDLDFDIAALNPAEFEEPLSECDDAGLNLWIGLLIARQKANPADTRFGLAKG
jgi:hypothetical protein